MPRNPHSRATSAAQRRSTDGAFSRRSVLRRGVGGGLALASLGALGTSGAAQSGEEGPAPPQNLEEEYWVGQSHGFRWEWSEDVCASNDLSHFHVTLREGEVVELPEDDDRSVDDLWPLVEEWTVDPDTPIVSFFVQDAGPFTLSVRAVDDEDRRSEPVRQLVYGGNADPAYTMSPSPERDSMEVGETVSVPIDFAPLVGGGEDVLSFELEAWLSTPCTASIVDVYVDDPSLSLVDATYADDGAAVTIEAAGDTGSQPFEHPLVTLEIVGEAPGGTVLHLENTALDVANDSSSLGATTRRAELSVASDLPAPENVRIGTQVSDRADVVWDWPGYACSDGISHFDVTVENDYGVEEYEVPPGRPTAPADLVGENDVVVTVRAVGEDGTTSSPATGRFYPSIADPGYSQHLETPDGLVPGETGSMSIGVSQVLGSQTNLMEFELAVETVAPCVATIEDVEVAAPWELQEAEFAEDGSRVRFVGAGQPPDVDDLFREQIATVELAGAEPGEALLRVDGESLRFLDEQLDYEEYRFYREYPEELPEDTELEDFVIERPLTDELTTVEVVRALPTVVGDSRPRDLDGDGLFRDVDGDGQVDQDDVVTFFEHVHTDAVAEHADAYDFSGNGAVNQYDTVELFEYVVQQ